MMRRQDRRLPRPRRIGFTLVELLVVITIIGILIALLLPVIVGAVRRANDARVAGDIQTLSAALARFKDTYGEFPPSRVILSESGDYSLVANSPRPLPGDSTQPLSAATWIGTVPPFGNPDISFGELAQRSLRALKKFFPRAVLAPDTSVQYFPDYNGNNTLDGNGYIYLEGHECLVFFLGGIPSPTTSSSGVLSYGVSGFGKEPKYPFKNNLAIPPSAAGPNVSTVNRTQPFYEFRGDRLLDEDNDGIPGYLDPLANAPQGRFYAYFASYGAAGYDPNDNNGNSPDNQPERDDNGNLVGIQFVVGHPLLANTATRITASPAPNPYTTSLPTPVNGTTFNEVQSPAYQNPTSFQIISAGGDNLFGPGGIYSTSGTKLPQYDSPYTQPIGIRDRENDNVTNFTSGRLN